MDWAVVSAGVSGAGFQLHIGSMAQIDGVVYGGRGCCQSAVCVLALDSAEQIDRGL